MKNSHQLRQCLIKSLLLFTPFFYFGCNNHKEEKIPKPNVLVIFTDDMNFEDIGAYGGNVLTPVLDSLIKGGVSLNNFRDCSAVCSPSRFNLLTGRYASRSKSLLKQFPKSDPPFLRWNVDIDMGERTMAHVMRENGYYTGLVGKYHNFQNEHIQDAIPEDANPNDPAIQSRIKANYDMLKTKVKESSGFEFVENLFVNNLHALTLPKSMQHHNMDWVTQGGVDFLDKAGEQPFFLYFATTLPHIPAPITSMYADSRITPSGILQKEPTVQQDRLEIIERVKNAGLPEEVAPYTWLDNGIGVLIKALEDKGILDNTIIVFASDHGGNDAKMTCYEKGVKAPAFMYWKNHFKPQDIQKMTANIDLAPTIYDLCNIKPKADEVIDGISLKPLIKNESIKVEPVNNWRKSLFLEITYSRAVVTNRYKYIAVRFPKDIREQITNDKNNLYNQEGTLYSANNPFGKNKARYNADQLYPGYYDRDQLYDLQNDPEEQSNLVSNPKYEKVLIEMRALLAEKMKDLPHNFGEFN